MVRGRALILGLGLLAGCTTAEYRAMDDVVLERSFDSRGDNVEFQIYDRDEQRIPVAEILKSYWMDGLRYSASEDDKVRIFLHEMDKDFEGIVREGDALTEAFEDLERAKRDERRANRELPERY